MQIIVEIEIELNFTWRFSVIHFIACDCNAFSLTGNCKEETGKCECKIGYHGSHCASCSPGYVGYPDCKPCSADGTNVNESSTNECSCKPNFAGDFCDKCICSDFKYPHCNGKVYSQKFHQSRKLSKNIFFSSEIDRIKTELAKVEDMSNFTDNYNCRSTEFGLNFLHVAAMHGLTDIITELVQFGTDIDSKDQISQTPIIYGIAFGKLQKWKQKPRDGLSWTKIFEFIGKKDAVIELLRLGANVKCHVDDYGLAPLDNAIAGNILIHSNI